MSNEPKLSPEVESIAWGELVLAGGRTFKDAKLWPGGAREWDWSETGTRHEPGIQPSDVEELLDHGADVVVLSRGMELRLHTCPDTVDALAAAGVEVHVEESARSVEIYNELVAAGRAVGALIHSTC